MKKFLATLAALAITIVPAVANARTLTESEINTYTNLIEAVKKAGVEFKLNPPACDENPNTFGWYNPPGRELVVCQENRVRGSRDYVRWTEEDLDTLRHEAHHLVQDCVDRQLNGHLHFLYEDTVGLVKNVLSTDTIDRIIAAYADKPDYVKMLELEAFSVAAMNDPQEQIGDIQTYCLSK